MLDNDEADKRLLNDDEGVPPPSKFCRLRDGFCSHCLCLTFSLLLLLMVSGGVAAWFLFPRQPGISYVESHLESKFKLKQTYEFRNTNWYAVTWSNLTLSTTLCSFTGDYPDWKLDCTLDPIGTATWTEPFTTPVRGHVNITTDFTLSVSAEQIIFMADACATSPHLLVFYTDGSVSAKMGGHNFGDQKITQISYVDCANI
jgi:hypothetical protein